MRDHSSGFTRAVTASLVGLAVCASATGCDRQDGLPANELRVEVPAGTLVSIQPRSKEAGAPPPTRIERAAERKFLFMVVDMSHASAGLPASSDLAGVIPELLVTRNGMNVVASVGSPGYSPEDTQQTEVKSGTTLRVVDGRVSLAPALAGISGEGIPAGVALITKGRATTESGEIGPSSFIAVCDSDRLVIGLSEESLAIRELAVWIVGMSNRRSLVCHDAAVLASGGAAVLVVKAEGLDTVMLGPYWRPHRSLFSLSW